MNLAVSCSPSFPEYPFIIIKIRVVFDVIFDGMCGVGNFVYDFGLRSFVFSH